MRPLLCFSRARLSSGLLRLSLLGSHITLRGGLVLLGDAFLFHRIVPSDGPSASLARPFMSSATPSTPALGPDSFAAIATTERIRPRGKNSREPRAPSEYPAT